MKNLNEMLNGDSINESMSGSLNMKGVELRPCLNFGEPAIAIGESISYNQYRTIGKKYEMCAKNLGVKQVESLDNTLERDNLIPGENEEFVLIYSLSAGRYPEINWYSVDGGSVEF